MEEENKLPPPSAAAIDEAHAAMLVHQHQNAAIRRARREGEDGENEAEEEEEPLTEEEQLVLFNERLRLARELQETIARVGKIQSYWKVELERLFQNEAEQDEQARALFRDVMIEEVESLSNGEYLFWKTEREESGAVEPGGNLSCEWFHDEVLQMLTPYLAVIPYPRNLTAEGAADVASEVQKVIVDATGGAGPVFVENVATHQLTQMEVARALGCRFSNEKDHTAENVPVSKSAAGSGSAPEYIPPLQARSCWAASDVLELVRPAPPPADPNNGDDADTDEAKKKEAEQQAEGEDAPQSPSPDNEEKTDSAAEDKDNKEEEKKDAVDKNTIAAAVDRTPCLLLNDSSKLSCNSRVREYRRRLPAKTCSTSAVDAASEFVGDAGAGGESLLATKDVLVKALVVRGAAVALQLDCDDDDGQHDDVVGDVDDDSNLAKQKRKKAFTERVREAVSAWAAGSLLTSPLLQNRSSCVYVLVRVPPAAAAGSSDDAALVSCHLLQVEALEGQDYECFTLQQLLALGEYARRCRAKGLVFKPSCMWCPESLSTPTGAAGATSAGNAGLRADASVAAPATMTASSAVVVNEAAASTKPRHVDPEETPAGASVDSASPTTSAAVSKPTGGDSSAPSGTTVALVAGLSALTAAVATAMVLGRSNRQ